MTYGWEREGPFGDNIDDGVLVGGAVVSRENTPVDGILAGGSVMDNFDLVIVYVGIRIC